MKKAFLAIIIFLSILPGKAFSAAFPSSEGPLASALIFQMNGVKISLQDYLTLTPKTYRQLTGKRLGIGGTVKLKMAQWKLKKLVNAERRVDLSKAKSIFDGSDFHLGGYLLGLFLGPLGVLIAYLINDDNKSERVKWAWWGLGSFFSILFAIYVIALMPA